MPAPNWSQIKRKLSAMPPNLVLRLIQELYDLSPANKSFLSARFLAEHDPTQIKPYRKRMTDPFYPTGGFGELNFADARKALAEYEKATGDLRGVIDLMVTFAETGARFTKQYGDIDERFYNAVESMLDKAIKRLETPEGKPLYPQFADRLQRIVKLSDGIGWGFHDNVSDAVGRIEKKMDEAMIRSRRMTTMSDSWQEVASSALLTFVHSIFFSHLSFGIDHSPAHWHPLPPRVSSSPASPGRVHAPRPRKGTPMSDLLYRIPPWAIIAIVAHAVVLLTVAYLILLERKVASWTQDRIGPNRVGLGFGIIPWLKNKRMNGLGQPLADGLKFIFKEDYQPAGVDKILFTIAPIIMMAVVVVSIAIIPFGGVHRVTKTFDITPKVSPADAAILANPALEKTPDYNAAYNRASSESARLIPINAQAMGATIQANTTTNDEGQTSTRITATQTYQYAFQIARLNIGALFVIAILSLAVYGVVLGGWASNNKYSFLGALRATAQMVSYEIPLGLSLLCIVVMFGTLELGELVDKQAHYWGPTVAGVHWALVPAWNVFTQPLAFFMFLICIHAEANRAPFDLAEAEQELVGGYHTEYSSMRFALFFLAEYAGMITTSAVCVALFFGGWHLPWLEFIWPALRGDVSTAHPEITTSLAACLVRALVYFIKVIAVIFVFMWVRWSLPRFRFDQLMMLAWRALIPISLALLMVTAVVIYFVGPHSPLFETLRAIDGKTALVFLAANIAMLILIVFISTLLPAPPATNRRVPISGSRFNTTPLPLTTNN
jgi:NADH:ubiquinone oxidoreductase subunit H